MKAMFSVIIFVSVKLVPVLIVASALFLDNINYMFLCEYYDCPLLRPHQLGLSTTIAFHGYLIFRGLNWKYTDYLGYFS